MERTDRKNPFARFVNKLCKLSLPALAAILIAVFAAGGTVAYLIANAPSVENQFTPSQVSCSVVETFDGTKKSEVNVQNTSNIDAYLRVRLLSYRVETVEGVEQHIGGAAAIPNFTCGAGWVHFGDYYYYTQPVASGETPAANLIGASGISLEDAYEDLDGGRQVIEVMAEAIQANPAKAVGEAWGVSIQANQVSAYTE